MSPAGARFDLVIFDNDGVLVDSEPHANRILSDLLTAHGSCVASSGTHERIRRALVVTGLFPRFEGRIFSAQDVTRGKPAPDLFLHAARSLGVDPPRCAVIEDSPLGVEAANAAGMIAFGFAAMIPPARLRHAIGGIFTSMEDLPGLLRSPVG